jgi:hypothetical protein
VGVRRWKSFRCTRARSSSIRGYSDRPETSTTCKSQRCGGDLGKLLGTKSGSISWKVLLVVLNKLSLRLRDLLFWLWIMNKCSWMMPVLSAQVDMRQGLRWTPWSATDRFSFTTLMRDLRSRSRKKPKSKLPRGFRRINKPPVDTCLNNIKPTKQEWRRFGLIGWRCESFESQH